MQESDLLTIDFHKNAAVASGIGRKMSLHQVLRRVDETSSLEPILDYCPIASKSFSFDINFDEYTANRDDKNGQLNIIEDAFNKYAHLIKSCRIVYETTKFNKIHNDSGLHYEPSCETKPHWHGIIQFNKVLSREEYKPIFVKISKQFSRTINNIAFVYKRIKGTQHLNDRKTYMMKEKGNEFALKII